MRAKSRAHLWLRRAEIERAAARPNRIPFHSLVLSRSEQAANRPENKAICMPGSRADALDSAIGSDEPGLGLANHPPVFAYELGDELRAHDQLRPSKCTAACPLVTFNHQSRRQSPNLQLVSGHVRNVG
jgi:hypothetical protein